MIKDMLRRLLEIHRTRGPLFLLKKVFLFPLDLVFMAYYSLTLRRRCQGADPEELLRVVFEGCRGMLRPFQVRGEIAELARVFSAKRPANVLEIGTAAGGTLFLFSLLAAEDANIISVDLPMGGFGGGYHIWRAILYRSFRGPLQRLSLLREDSHSPRTAETVRALLGGKELDFLFIDGDHTYEGVKKDFQMYSGLVRKGGVIAFHDIAEHPSESGCGVDRFWREIREKYPHREIISDTGQQWAGIGVLLV